MYIRNNGAIKVCKYSIMYEFPEYIKENSDFLRKVSKTKSEKNTLKYLKSANADQILAIVEICTKANFKLNTRQRRKLATFADYYRAIARSRTERTARHRIQHGGQVGALAAILAPVLGSLAQHILDKTLLKKVDNNENSIKVYDE